MEKKEKQSFSPGEAFLSDRKRPWHPIVGCHDLTHMGSGFADELFTATGTADIDLALVTGDTNTLLAVGATEISVVPILQAVPEAEELLILGLSAVNVFGKHTEKDQYHTGCIDQTEGVVENGIADDNIQQIIHQA